MIPTLLIFDLDGTLTESKQPLTNEMALRVKHLLTLTRVAVTSGGALPQFLSQIVEQLPSDTNFAQLYLLPTSGAALYEYQHKNWKKIYEERLSEKEAETIAIAMHEAAEETGLIDFSQPVYGERIEYRGGQVTLSALGQRAPLTEKKVWDIDHTKRHALQELLAKKLPKYLVGIGGITSIDVTKRGIDKAYGIRQLCKRLHIEESDVLYIGDELGVGGNDEAVYKTKARVRNVEDIADTARIIDEILTGA